MGLWVFAKIVAQGIQKVFPCPKVGVSVVGLEVAHAHIHLMPIHSVADMNFDRPKLSLSQEEMMDISKRLREAVMEVTHTSK